MLSFKEFILEALKGKEEAKILKDLIKHWNPKQYKEFFKSWESDSKVIVKPSAYRLYLGYQSADIHKETGSDKPNAEVVKALTDAGYKIRKYGHYLGKGKAIGGSLKVGLVTSPKGKEVNITSALNSIGRPELKDVWHKDPYHDDLIICVTANPSDIVGMSMNTRWSEVSCMNFKRHRGEYAYEYLPMDLEQGSMVGYLIRRGDTYIKDPLARVTIRPYYGKDEEDIVLFPAFKAYCDKDLIDSPELDMFQKRLLDFVTSVHSKQGIAGTFDIKPYLYTDESVERVTITNFKTEKDKKDYDKLRRKYILETPFVENDFKDVSEEVAFQFVIKQPRLISYIKNPSKKIIDDYCKLRFSSLEFLDSDIKLSDQNIIDKLESTDYKEIYYVKNPSENVQDYFFNNITPLYDNYYFKWKGIPTEKVLIKTFNNKQISLSDKRSLSTNIYDYTNGKGLSKELRSLMIIYDPDIQTLDHMKD